MATRYDEPVNFNAPVKFAGGVTLPQSCVGDAQFSSVAPLTADKQQHQYPQRHTQAHGTAAAAERRVVHVAKSAGQVADFLAGVVVACVGDSTISVDLRKNGTTVLSAAVGLSSANAAFAKVTGTISVANYAPGDVFEVVVTVSAGTGALGQGLFAQAVFREAA